MFTKTKLKVTLIVLVFIALAGSSGYADTSTDETIRQLDNHLSTLSHDAKSARQIMGGVTMGVGTLSLGLGIYDIALFGKYVSPYDLLLLGSIAGFGIAGGLYMEFWPSVAEGYYRQFLALPREKDDEKTLAINLGEKFLADLAVGGTVVRIVVGSLFTAGGLSFCGLLIYSLSLTSFQFTDFDTEMIVFAGLCLLPGLICLLVPSLAERELASYRDWKAGNSKPVSEYGPSLHVAVSPTGVALKATF